MIGPAQVPDTGRRSTNRTLAGPMGGATAPVCGHSIILIALVSRAEFDRLGRAGGFTGLAAAAAGSARGCAACEAARCRVELAEVGVFCTAQRPRGRGVSALIVF